MQSTARVLIIHVYNFSPRRRSPICQRTQTQMSQKILVNNDFACLKIFNDFSLHTFNLIFFSLFIIHIFLACQTAVHKKCHDKLLGTCSESSFNSESTIVSCCVIFTIAIQIVMTFSHLLKYQQFFILSAVFKRTL